LKRVKNPSCTVEKEEKVGAEKVEMHLGYKLASRPKHVLLGIRLEH